MSSATVAAHDIDLSVWTELKLSEFYAAKEAYDACEATDD